MLFVVDKTRLQKIIAIVREDRTKRSQTTSIPHLRIEASGDTLTLTSSEVSATFPCTVYQPGVLFIPTTLFRRVLKATKVDETHLTFQVTDEALIFADVRFPFETNDMILYRNPKEAPVCWPPPLPESETVSENTQRFLFDDRALKLKEETHMINNKWTQGARRWTFPPLPIGIKGQVGCRLEKEIIDSSVGEELFVVILDDPTYAGQLANTKPFELFCASGMAETSHGAVIFLLFTVKSRGREITTYELLVNPYSIEMVHRLSLWSEQTHLKVFLFDNQDGKELNWYEFANTFEIGKLLPVVQQFISPDDEHDFTLAQQEFYRDNDLDELKRMSS